MQAFVSSNDLTRFWSKVDQSGGPEACWTWQASFNTPAHNAPVKRRGRGSRRPVFKLCGCVVYAHRLSLALSCVNPRHLYWGTPEQNRLDSQRFRARTLSEPLL